MTTELIPSAEHAPPAAHRAKTTRRLTAVSLVAGVLTILCSGLMLLAPVSVNSPTVQWPLEATSPKSTMLPLSAYKPMDFDLEFGCDAVRAAQASGGAVFATMPPGVPAAGERGLVVRAADGRVSVRGMGVTLLDEPVRAGGCRYQVAGDTSGVRVLRDGAEVGRGPAGVLPDFHVLATTIGDLPSADLSLRVRVDDQFNTSPAPAKYVLMVVLVLSAVTGIVCLVLLDRRINRPEVPRRPKRFRLRLVDVVVPAAMALWVFLAPMSDDDGYYSAMAKNVQFEGYVGMYYQIHNQNFTPFAWFYYFLAKWQEAFGVAPVVLRIPALLFGLVTWFAVRRLTAGANVLPESWRERGPWVDRGVRTVLAIVFLTWWLPLDMGVRPEGVVTMCGALTLLAVAVGVERQRLVPFGAAVGIAAIGFFAHPTGFTVLGPLLAGLPLMWKVLRAQAENGRVVAARVLAVLSPAGFAALIALADGSLREFQLAQQVFLRIQAQESWYTEWVRYMFLFNSNDPMGNYAKRAPVMVCIVALIWFVVLMTAARARRIPVPPRLALAGWATMFAFLLLWFTPSKWTHHFGSPTGLGVTFLTLFLVGSIPLFRQLTRDRPLPWGLVIGLAGSTVAIVALAAHGVNKWPYSWLLGMPHANVKPYVSVIKLDNPFLWALGLVVVALLVRWWAKRRAPGWRPYAAVLAVPVVVLVFFTATTGYLVGGFAVATWRTLDTWSPWAASVQDPLAEDCVAADGIEVLDLRNARPLQPAAGQPATDQTVFPTGRGWYEPAPPPVAADRAWGSRVQRGPGQTLEQNTGTLRTPWFELGEAIPERGALATQVSGRLMGGNTLRVEFGDRGGRVLGQRELQDGGDTVVWRNLVLAEDGQVPAGATSVRLTATDATADQGGWMAVTAPSVQRPVPLKDYLPRDAAVAVAWQFAFLFPCQRQPVLRDGIIEPISYAVQWGDTPFSGLGDATWQVNRGGLFGDVIYDQSITNLTARFRDFPGHHPLQVYQTEAAYPGGQFALTVQRHTLYGWEALR